MLPVILILMLAKKPFLISGSEKGQINEVDKKTLSCRDLNDSLSKCRPFVTSSSMHGVLFSGISIISLSLLIQGPLVLLLQEENSTTDTQNFLR